MPAKPPAGRSRAGRLVLRILLGTALAIALLAAGHALVWRWMGSQMQSGFDDWVASRRAIGWKVTHGPPERGGWPFAATLTLPQFRLEGGGNTLPGGLDWQAEQLMLRVALPRLDRLVVEAPGRHRLRLGWLELPFATDRLTIAVPLERNVLPREAEMQAERLRIATPTGSVELREGRLGIETRLTATEGEPAVQLSLNAEDITLPPAPPALVALGRQIGRLVAEVALTGPVPPGRGVTAKAEAWRDGGGTLELKSLDLAWGPASALATATVTLDDTLQPMGAGTLKLRGATALLDAAQAAGLLPPRAALGARAAVRMMSRTPPEGGPPQLEVPLTLEERTLSLSRFPILRMPALAWPAPPAMPDAAQDPSLPARD